MTFYFDTHTHAVSSDTGRYPVRPLGGIRSDWSRTRPVDGDELIARLDEAGVAYAALVQASTVYGFDNRYAADVLARHPDRLVGVCSVDFLSAKAVEDLRYWIEDRGFRGVRIRIADGDTKVADRGAGLSDERMAAVWDYADGHGVPVSVQMHSKNTGDLLAVLREHPALTVVLDHLARPDVRAPGELEQLAAFPGVHLKITPSALRRLGADAAEVLPRLAKAFGTDHLMWGSDFPATAGSMRESRELIERELPWLTRPERDAVLGHNAARVYHVPVAD